MMRHTIIFLSVLFVSTLCSSTFGMPLDKRGEEKVESVQSVHVSFLLAGGREVSTANVDSTPPEFTQSINKFFEGYRAGPVIFDNGWKPDGHAGDHYSSWVKVYCDKCQCPKGGCMVEFSSAKDETGKAECMDFSNDGIKSTLGHVHRRGPSRACHFSPQKVAHSSGTIAVSMKHAAKEVKQKRE
ncbi:hypothetical protein BDP27DRAFT_1319001 [Rhodocollybia butyracea]|uniref:Secreted protein n=1 Tax=Rhodocollybia butyracea TaxID=206335 RepID=A0A9P5Q2Z2_9AGAR|nr:hypothetical protein BDP27DRAFT_1319001 [Rhodocollybia butyracea]